MNPPPDVPVDHRSGGARPVTMSVSKAKGRVCREEKWLVAPPTVHISHRLIGRGVLLLGVGPLLMNVWETERWWRQQRESVLVQQQQHLNGFICIVYLTKFPLASSQLFGWECLHSHTLCSFFMAKDGLDFMYKSNISPFICYHWGREQEVFVKLYQADLRLLNE